MWTQLFRNSYKWVSTRKTLASTSSDSHTSVGHRMKLLNDNKQFKQALDLFDALPSEQTKQLSSVAINQALKACTRTGNLQRGVEIHRLVPSRMANDSFLLPSLIQLYMQGNDVRRAESLFDAATNKTKFTYGAMMKGYITNGMPAKAINLFRQLNDPSDVMVNLLFNACAQLPTEESLHLVRRVWKELSASARSNAYILTSLLDALMKCGAVEDAELIFDGAKIKDVTMHGAMMKGYIKNEMPAKAINIFERINNPNNVIANLLFNACAQLPTEESLHLVRRVWKELSATARSNTYILTSLLDALMKCGAVEDAELIFDGAKVKDVTMYAAMMKGYIKNEMPAKAINIFERISNPNNVTANLLFNACARLPRNESLRLVKQVWKELPTPFRSDANMLTSLLDALMTCGDVREAEAVFANAKEKAETMYGAMMKGYTLHEMAPRAMDLYLQMTKQSSMQLNAVSYLLTIKALSKIGLLPPCEAVVQQIPQSLFSNQKIANALIDMWGKVSNVMKAEQVFAHLSSPDNYSYATMINVYGLNGMGLKAVQLFHEVPRGLMADATYVSTLNACSHSGLVNEARAVFENAPSKTVKAYGAMVDCLSRAGLFEEAQELIERYEQNHPSAWPMYMALLSGARNEKNKELGQKIFHQMKKLFPDSVNPLVSAAVLLANIYASSGEMDKAFAMRMQLSQSGTKKKAGLTWTFVRGQLAEFHAHDWSHPRSKEIHREVETFSRELVAHGHEYDSSWVTRPLDSDETVESVLCGHSERLAIAWNFVADPTTTNIQVTKNLRICGDCHRATKLIAAIRRCHIVVRDANRIHHFHPNGQCSCNDYF